MVLFVILAALGSTAISATVGVTSLSLYGLAEWSDYRSIWLTWWLGDAAGAVVVTPVLLLWYANPRVAWSRQQSVEALVLLLALVVVGWLAFVRMTFGLAFLVLPLGVWAGFRFGAREAATATCVLSVIAVWGTANGLGSFGSESPNTALLLLQAFMSVNTIIGITVGTTVASRQEAVDHARRLNDDLERRVRVRTAELLAARRLAHEGARLKGPRRLHIGSWEWRCRTVACGGPKNFTGFAASIPKPSCQARQLFLSLYIQTTAHH